MDCVIITYSFVFENGIRAHGAAEDVDKRYRGVYEAVKLLWTQRKTVSRVNICKLFESSTQAEGSRRGFESSLRRRSKRR
jgi:hypothetical protein